MFKFTVNLTTSQRKISEGLFRELNNLLYFPFRLTLIVLPFIWAPRQIFLGGQNRRPRVHVLQSTNTPHIRDWRQTEIIAWCV